MPIQYASVSCGSTILADCSVQGGFHDEVVARILLKLPSEDGKMTFVQERTLYHCLVKENLIFLCIADDTFGIHTIHCLIQGRRIPFSFLQDAERIFNVKYGKTYIQPIAYSLAEFSKSFTELITLHNQPDSDMFRKVQGDLDNVKDIMVENIGNQTHICQFHFFRKSYGAR